MKKKKTSKNKLKINKINLITIISGIIILVTTIILIKINKKPEVFETTQSLQNAKIVFSGSGPTSIGSNFNLKAYLTDENNNPLSNQKIIFTHDQNWNYSVSVFTNDNGIAEYSMPIINNENTTGFIQGKNYQFNAYFQGSKQYLSVHAYTNLNIGGNINFSETKISSPKQYSIESLPYFPWGEPTGDDNVPFPHGVLYYQPWKNVGYDFLNKRDSITLPDGRTIQKPIIYGLLFHTRANGDLSPSNLGSYECSSGVKVPRYCDNDWMNAYLAQVADLGKNLDGKIDGVMVSFGYDGEANMGKTLSACEDELRLKGCTTAKVSAQLSKAIDAHVKAFPNTPVFVQGAPKDPQKAIDNNFGYKLNSFHPGSGYWIYDGSNSDHDYDAWIKNPNMLKAFESKAGGSGLYRTYWMILTMLNPKPDFIDFFDGDNWGDLGHWAVFKKLPWFYDFVFYTLGKNSTETNHVWSVSREVPDNNKKESSLYPNRYSGVYGDFQFYLYRKENIANNQTISLEYTDSVFEDTYKKDGSNEFDYDQPYTNRSISGGIADPNNNWQPQTGLIYETARTNAPDNNYMSYDIDNGWQYAGISPEQEEIDYEVVLIYLDNGDDTFSIEYPDKNGDIKQININKINTGRWIRTSDNDPIIISDAYFNDQLDGMTDIRINNNNDGNEIIHMLEVKVTDSPQSNPPTNSPCNSDCTNKSCGELNDCGEKCNGSCPSGQICNNEYVCISQSSDDPVPPPVPPQSYSCTNLDIVLENGENILDINREIYTNDTLTISVPDSYSTSSYKKVFQYLYDDGSLGEGEVENQWNKITETADSSITWSPPRETIREGGLRIAVNLFSDDCSEICASWQKGYLCQMSDNTCPSVNTSVDFNTCQTADEQNRCDNTCIIGGITVKEEDSTRKSRNPDPSDSTQLINLKQGWNLVSFSSIVPTSPDQIFASLIEKGVNPLVWTLQNDIWYLYSNIDYDYENHISTIEREVGYWINVDKDIDLEYNIDPNQVSYIKPITLDSGWNLIGTPHNFNKDTSSIDNQSISSIWTFDSNTQNWKLYPNFGDSYQSLIKLEPNVGYYIYTDSSTQITE